MAIHEADQVLGVNLDTSQTVMGKLSTPTIETSSPKPLITGPVQSLPENKLVTESRPVAFADAISPTST